MKTYQQMNQDLKKKNELSIEIKAGKKLEGLIPI